MEHDLCAPPLCSSIVIVVILPPSAAAAMAIYVPERNFLPSVVFFLDNCILRSLTRLWDLAVLELEIHKVCSGEGGLISEVDDGSILQDLIVSPFSATLRASPYSTLVAFSTASEIT